MPALRPGQSVVGDTAANLASINPILQRSIIGVEHDTGKGKIGDGVTAWNDLEYVIQEAPAPYVPPPDYMNTYTTGNMTVYVDKDATGNNDGTSPTDAFTSLQDAINSIPYNIEHYVDISIAPGDYTSEGTIYIAKNVDESNGWVEIYPTGYNYLYENECGENTTPGRIITDNTEGVYVGDHVFAYNYDANGVIATFVSSTITAVEPNTYVDIADTSVIPTNGWEARSSNIKVSEIISNIESVEFYAFDVTGYLLVYRPNMTYFYHCIFNRIKVFGGHDPEFRGSVIDTIHTWGCDYIYVVDTMISSGFLLESNVEFCKVYQTNVGGSLYVQSTTCLAKECNFVSVNVDEYSDLVLQGGRVLSGGPYTISSYNGVTYTKDYISSDMKVLYVNPSATGKGDGSSAADGFTTIQAALDSVPRSFSGSTLRLILSRGTYTSTVKMHKFTSRANSALVDIQGTWYTEDCASNAVAGRIVPDGSAPSDIQNGDTISAWNSTTGEAFVATVTGINSDPYWINTSETTMIPTTGWTCLLCTTVFQSSFYSDVDYFKISGVCFSGSNNLYNAHKGTILYCIVNGSLRFDECMSISLSNVASTGYIGVYNGSWVAATNLSLCESYIQLENCKGTIVSGIGISDTDPCLILNNSDISLYNTILSGDIGIRVTKSIVSGENNTNTCTTPVQATYDGASIIYASLVAGITSGAAAPTSTPVKVGDIYIDTTNKKVYIATGTSSSSDWTVVN